MGGMIERLRSLLDNREDDKPEGDVDQEELDEEEAVEAVDADREASREAAIDKLTGIPQTSDD
jgi:hypothetical protein